MTVTITDSSRKVNHLSKVIRDKGHSIKGRSPLTEKLPESIESSMFVSHSGVSPPGGMGE